MKNLMIVSTLAVLAACSPAETTDEPAAPVEVVETEAAMTAADGGPTTGTFKVTDADGKVSMEVLNADGTYTSTTEGEEPKTGKWEQKSPNSYCATPDEEGAVQKCYTETVDANGVWTSVDPDDGKSSTVERVEA